MHTYEVFLRREGREGFAHVGSLDAPDDELARLYCRETYVRRGEGNHAWVVRRDHVLEVDHADRAVTTGRHHAVNDGTVVAARRRARRSEAG
jgi:ring-1,2-phenylacetyl-CoA epoxidase subunit PaaB